MKKTIITALFAAVCVAPAFAAGQTISANRIGVNADYTMVDVDGGEWNFMGIAIQGSHDFYKFEGGTTLTLTGTGYIGQGELEYDAWEGESVDTMRYGVKVGVNANFQVSEKATIYVGPTLGYQTISFDEDGWDDETGLTYGLTVGVRYMLNNQKTCIEAGLSHDWNKTDELENEDGDKEFTSNTIFVGVHHSF